MCCRIPLSQSIPRFERHADLMRRMLIGLGWQQNMIWACKDDPLKVEATRYLARTVPGLPRAPNSRIEELRSHPCHPGQHPERRYICLYPSNSALVSWHFFCSSVYLYTFPCSPFGGPRKVCIRPAYFISLILMVILMSTNAHDPVEQKGATIMRWSIHG